LGVEIGPVIEHRRKKIKFKNFRVIIEVEIEEEIDKGRGGLIWLRMKEI
jgi:archaeosine-15-forming tRNA-guanine transglycosylase